MAQFDLSGQIRPRAEYRHGYGNPIDREEEPAFFVDQRTRLSLGYDSSRIRFKVRAQDIRIWGGQDIGNGVKGYLNLHSAWGSYALSEAFSIRVGRQELAYDDERVLGAGDWGQGGTTHDMALFRFHQGAYRAELGAAFNQDRASLTSRRYGMEQYKALQSLWVNRDKNGFYSSLLFLNNGMPERRVGIFDEDQELFYSHTTGTHLEYEGDGFGALGAFYYQFGSDERNRELDAFNAKGSFYVKLLPAFGGRKKETTDSASISESKKPLGLTLTAGYEHLSGNSQLDRSYRKNRAFSPIYGTNHGPNGVMDFFYVGGRHENSVGLMDPFLKLNYRSPKFSIGLHGHYFMAAADVLDRDHFFRTGELRQMDRAFGPELDLIVRYSLHEDFQLEAGYAQFFPRSTMTTLRGGAREHPQNWAYLMLNWDIDFL